MSILSFGKRLATEVRGCGLSCLIAEVNPISSIECGGDRTRDELPEAGTEQLRD
jgi:hypothetical protein